MNQKTLTTGHAYGSALELHRAGRFREAESLLREVLSHQPDDLNALQALACALTEQGEIDRAIVAYESALSYKPDHAGARWGVSLLRLLKGDFARGWIDYEARWEAVPALRRPNFPQPLWDGSDLKGRRILLYPEQGFGDLIQAIRYVSLVRAAGARSVVFAPPELRRLWQTHPDIDRIVTEADVQPEFDVHCPLMSLPRLFGTTLQTIPAPVPYLSADGSMSDLWKRRLSAQPPGLKVGLSWAGRPTHLNDRNRSLALSTLAPLGRLSGVRYYSLQKGEAGQQAAAPPAGMQLVDWTHEIRDFADTAALVVNLDLVICCDSAVAHLAGALGKPVWVLLPFVPDWRWQLDRDDSPWYPTMRLFRQTRTGDWPSVVERVARELQALPHRNVNRVGPS